MSDNSFGYVYRQIRLEKQVKAYTDFYEMARLNRRIWEPYVDFDALEKKIISLNEEIYGF